MINRSFRMLAAAVVATAVSGCATAGMGTSAPSSMPDRTYDVFVASESADQISRIRFGPEGARVVEEREVGIRPADLDGPHGLIVAPGGEHYYVTIAHGTPFGKLLKISAETGEVVGQTVLGLFPATVDVTPDGQYAFVSNFNFHGDPVPSSISKVYLPTMTEVARTETCVMPHGSRVNPQGTKQYSVCMMDQMLVEIDVATGLISRLFSVAPGQEGPAPVGAAADSAERTGPERDMAMDHAMGGEEDDVCSPTWAQPGADGEFVYVACNQGDEIIEIDTETWEITRRFPTGANPYNLGVTPDGRYLLATLKNRDAPATEVIDLESGRTVAQVPNTDVLPHGVTVTPDSRYAFVSVEGVGADPGKVDVIDLRGFERIASIGVGQQAGGIAVVPTAN